MSLRLKVPFSYAIEYVPKRKRTVYTTAAFATAELEVKPAKGPVKLAFQLGCSLKDDSEHMKLRSVFHAPEGSTLNVYRAEDAYWVEVCGADQAPDLLADRRKMDKDPFDVLYQAGDRGFDLSLSRSKEAQTRAQVEKDHEKEGGLRRWDDDGTRGHRATENLMRRRAQYDLREIDGKLCMRVSEPALGYHLKWNSSSGGSAGTYTTTLVVDQSRRQTPAGFHLFWDLKLNDMHRWHIGETVAAIAFDKAISDKSSKPIKNAVTIGHMDVSDCVFEGRKVILESAINKIRKQAIERVREMDGTQLSAVLELQHLFDRDAGRLSPDYIQAARRLLELMECHRRAEVTEAVRWTMRNEQLYGSHFHSTEPSFDQNLSYLKIALDAYDSRPRDGRDWIDQALPCGALAAPRAAGDVVEVLTRQDGHRLVDAGGDRAVVAALDAAAAGEARVICIEEAKEVHPHAGVLVRDDFGGWRLDRTIAPPGAEGGLISKEYRSRFESFVQHANALATENEALLSLAI